MLDIQKKTSGGTEKQGEHLIYPKEFLFNLYSKF